MTESLRVDLLGPLGIGVGGEEVDVRAFMPRALVALLAIRPNTVVATDRLIDELWEGEPPDGARATIQSYVSTLRRRLREHGLADPTPIETRQPGYVLRLADGEADVLSFRRHIGLAQQALTAGHVDDAHPHVMAALSLIRGPVLDEFGHLDAIRLFAADIEERRCWAIEQRVEYELATGNASELVAELRTLVREYPLEERFWALLMRALYESGRQTEALRAYQQLREVLDTEIGVAPAPSLQELDQAILRHELVVTSSTGAPRRPGGRPRAIPRNVTPLIGRSAALARLRDAVDHHRIVTLTGPGGCGKTRLASELASSIYARLDGRVWWVELTEVDEPARLIDAVATSLGLFRRRQDEIFDLVVADMSTGPAMLVLDNCEHLIDEAAALAVRLIEECPQLTLLCTSREALTVAGELVELVAPLEAATPLELTRHRAGPPTPAATLFLERASAAHAGFAPDEGALALVEAICTELDGIPLAIELAAPLVAGMSLDDIVDHLLDRFGSLPASMRSKRPQHRTLDAVVSWSYDLLAPPERMLFEALSVFRGPFSLRAAEAVAEPVGVDTRTLLPALVRKSMIVSDSPPRGAARYRMLETLRRYGEARCDERGKREAVIDAFVGHYVTNAERWRFRQQTTATAWFDALGPDLVNIQTAIRLAMARDVDSALVLIDAFHWYFNFLGQITETRAWLRALIDEGQLDDQQRVVALTSLAALANFGGAYGETDELAEEAVHRARELGDEERLAAALIIRGTTAVFEGNTQRAAECFIESTALSEDLGDVGGMAAAMVFWGVAYRRARDFEQAQRCFERAFELFSDLHDDRGLALVLINLGRMAQQRGDPARGALLCERGLALAEGCLDSVVVGLAGLFRGRIAVEADDLEGVERYLETGLAAGLSVEHRVIVSACLEWMAMAAQTHGDHASLARVAGFTEIHRRAPATADPRPELEAGLTLARRALGAEMCDELRAAGSSDTLETALRIARDALRRARAAHA